MIRPLTESDLPAMTNLCAKALPLEPLTWTPALVREKSFGDRDFDPELMLGFETGGALRGFAVGVAKDHLGERRAWTRLFAVNPAWMGQGIGTALIDEVERRCAARGATRIGVMDAIPNYLTPGVDFRYTPAICFFTKRKYEKRGVNTNLMCDLLADPYGDCDAAIVNLGKKGFEVRRAEATDRAMCAAWAEKEFKGWMEEIDACFKNDPISLWICVDRREGRREMIGFSAYDSNNLDTGFYGPLGVGPATRGHGAGALLTRLCLRDQKRQGHRQAVIPWVGPVRFYQKTCGAWMDRQFWAFEKKLA
ncbi:MAG: GNAT family N-acetyltransferase [Candidatus Sumerlaeia bacterium]|nr:GNAT family N-acetyltransferase [Candidatus Sumerlaeia bacterium]